MNYLRKLIGQKCFLSPIDASETEKVARWSNNIEVAIKTGDISDMITYEAQLYMEIMCMMKFLWIYLAKSFRAQ